MKRTKQTVLGVIVLALSVVMVPGAMAGETPLSTVIDNWLTSQYGDTHININAADELSSIGLFDNWGGSSKGIIVKEIAGFANTNQVGWYWADPASPVTHNSLIFGGSDSENAIRTFDTNTTNDDPLKRFGFWLKTPKQAGITPTFYTEAWRNLDQFDHFQIYLNPNSTETQYIIACEDLWYGGGAKPEPDYNDFVFAVGPVPEPGSMMLLGIGLAGAFGASRRKAKKA